MLGSADLRVAAAVAGIDGEEAGQLADALADVGVLGWERPLTFLHPFERHSVYAEMPRARRATAHANAAQILAARGGEPIEIARHLTETDPSGDEWTAAVWSMPPAGRSQPARSKLPNNSSSAPTSKHPSTCLRSEIALLRAQVDGLLGRRIRGRHLARAARLEPDPASTRRDRARPSRSAARSLVVRSHSRNRPIGTRHLVTDHPQSALRLELTESVLLAGACSSDHTGHGIESDIDDREIWPPSPTGRLVAMQRTLRRAQRRCDSTADEMTETLGSLLTPTCWQVAGSSTPRSSAHRCEHWFASARTRWSMP